MSPVAEVSRRMRRFIVCALIVPFAALLAVGWTVVSAEEDDENDKIAGETITTTLHPGENFVGWVAEPKPVAELFAEFPQIDLIYTWDTLAQRYRLARPATVENSRLLEVLPAQSSILVRVGDGSVSIAELIDAEPALQLVKAWNSADRRYDAVWSWLSPETGVRDVLPPRSFLLISLEGETTIQSLLEALQQIESVYGSNGPVTSSNLIPPKLATAANDLQVLTPGMAVVIRVGGKEPVEWTRPITPVRGLVKLYAGENWVSWAGRSGWTITDVVRGIGKSLIRVEADGLEYSPLDPATAGVWSQVIAGDGLQVTVSRDTRWLQPTGVLPKFRFTGTFSQSLRREYIDMTRNVIDQFAATFGVEADPTILDWIIFNGCSEEHGHGCAPGAGRAGHHFAAVDVGCGPDYHPLSKPVLTHEYFHVLQGQLSGKSDLLGPHPPQWMIEGQAQWISSYLLGEAPNVQADVRCANVTLQESEGWVQDLCHYTLGEDASDSLATVAGSEAIAEFWRQIAPASIHATGQWVLAQRWEDAFRSTFGMSIDEFYAQFSSERGSSESDQDREPQVGGDVATVEGYVLDGAGRGVPGVVVASSDPSNLYGDLVYAITDDEGEFTLLWDADATYQIKVYPLDYQLQTRPVVGELFGGCGYWIGDAKATLDRDSAKLFRAENVADGPLRIQLSSDLCSVKIQGMIVSARSQPLKGMHVVLERPGEYRLLGVRTDVDGSFETIGDKNESYRLRFSLHEGGQACELFWDGHNGVNHGRNDAMLVVADVDVTGLLIEIPTDACNVSVIGRLADSNNVGLQHVRLFVEDAMGRHVASARTTDHGAFSIPVMETGVYIIKINRYEGDSCYYMEGGATTERERATRVYVGVAVETRVLFQLPDSGCGRSMSGKLIGRNGNGVSGVWLYFDNQLLPNRKVQTEADGSFSISGLDSTEYRVGVSIDGCWMYLGLGDPTSNVHRAPLIDVAGGSVAGVRLRLPVDPASFCN